MAKPFDRAIKLGGTDMKVGTPVVTVLEFDIDGNVARAKGATLPTDGDAGYAKGCKFIDTDASAGAIEYINEGTATSASFRASVSGTAPTETVAATNVILASESGKTFFLSHATEFVSTLPAPAAGLRYSFIVANAPETASYTIVSASGTDNIHGQVVSAEDAAGSGDSTNGTAADTITFVDSKAVIGDRVDLICDGTLWYAIAYATVQDGITFTAT